MRACVCRTPVAKEHAAAPSPVPNAHALQLLFLHVILMATAVLGNQNQICVCAFVCCCCCHHMAAAGHCTAAEDQPIKPSDRDAAQRKAEREAEAAKRSGHTRTLLMTNTWFSLTIFHAFTVFHGFDRCRTAVALTFIMHETIFFFT